jgi:acyl-CoA dehydrogenase family protein 9
VTISRTQRLIEERGAEACAREIALTDLFCLQSGQRFRASRDALDSKGGETIDSLRRQIAARVREEGGYRSRDALLDTAVPPLPAWGLMRDEQQRAVERG